MHMDEMRGLLASFLNRIFRITPTGDIGINTDPVNTVAFRVAAAGSADTGFEVQRTAANNTALVSWDRTGGASTNMQYVATQHRWDAGGAQGMLLNSTRNLGIGITPGATHRLDVNGSLRIASTTMLFTSVSFTNGAGAAAGTLANAPVAGNPTKWIPIDDNGTVRYIPAW